MAATPVFENTRSVLLDTNLLILYLVGSTNRQRIRRFKRTQRYTENDFDLVVTLLSNAGVCLTTPHILTQVSDLVKLDEPEFTDWTDLFRAWINATTERRAAAVDLIQHPVFHRIGLADSSIAEAAEQGTVIVTDDFDLYLALAERGLPVINFNHLRFPRE